MKRIGNKLLLLLTAALIITMMSASAFAEDGHGTCYFDGNKIVSDFSSGTIADSVSNLQPGDDMSFTVEYTNKDSHDTDWYMETSILQTLEKTDEAKKTVAGTGTAENGGYTYELIQYDKDNKKNVLFSNAEVGGEKKVTDLEDSFKELEGLEPATNALDEWFYLQSLDKGESGKITLRIAFDGETEVNDYMDTNGSVELAFAVDKPKTVTKPSRPSGTPASPGRKAVKSGVRTGDYTRLLPYVLLMLTGIILLIAVLKYKGGESDETE